MSVAPAEQYLPLARDRPLDFLLAGNTRCRFLGQEHHAHAVLTVGRQSQALPPADAAQERVGHLDEYSGAVTLQRIGPGCAAVREIPEYLQRLRNDGVALVTFDVGDEAQTAGIMLVARVVQALPARWQLVRFARSLAHVVLTACAVPAGRRRDQPRDAAGMAATGATACSY